MKPVQWPDGPRPTVTIILLHVLNLVNLGTSGIIAKPRICAYTQVNNYNTVLEKKMLKLVRAKPRFFLTIHTLGACSHTAIRVMCVVFKFGVH